jgi:hypothetical protein
MTACAGILTYVWPLIHGKGLLVTISVLYGCAQTFAHITARVSLDQYPQILYRHVQLLTHITYCINGR